MALHDDDDRKTNIFFTENMNQFLYEIRNPAEFVEGSLRDVRTGPGMTFVKGKLKDARSDEEVIQAVLFEKDSFTFDQAENFIFDNQNDLLFSEHPINDPINKPISPEGQKPIEIVIRKGDSPMNITLMKQAELKSVEGVEVFSAGKWNGDIYTIEDLDIMVQAFDETRGGIQPHIKLGHDDGQKIIQTDGLPAAGWIGNLYRSGEKLYADFVDIPKKVFQLIENKAYR